MYTTTRAYTPSPLSCSLLSRSTQPWLCYNASSSATSETAPGRLRISHNPDPLEASSIPELVGKTKTAWQLFAQKGDA